MMLRTICFSSLLTFRMSRSKSKIGARGCPVIFIKQFTLTVLENEPPMFKSLSDTPFTMCCACMSIWAS